MRLQPRDLDVGVFNEKNFVYVASFGAFTRTAYTVPQDIKNMFGHFAYLLEGVKDLETLRSMKRATRSSSAMSAMSRRRATAAFPGRSTANTPPVCRKSRSALRTTGYR